MPLVLFAIAGSLVATDSETGRLEIPTTSTPVASVAVGLQRLGLGGLNGGLLYVPKSYRANEPLPLLILLHAAEGTSASWFSGEHKEMPGSFSSRPDTGRFIVSRARCARHDMGHWAARVRKRCCGN